MSNEKCPFKVGATVVYRPSTRGRDLDVMSSHEQQLRSGKKYEIERIEKGNYIVVKGYKHPGGGIYWTEFSAS